MKAFPCHDATLHTADGRSASPSTWLAGARIVLSEIY